MPVPVPSPLPTQDRLCDFFFSFCNAGHPVVLKYSQCLSLGWRWLPFAVSALKDSGHAPLGSSPVACLGGGTGHKSSPWGTGKCLGWSVESQPAPGQGWGQGWETGLARPPWGGQAGEGWWGEGMARAGRCWYRSTGHQGWPLSLQAPHGGS